MAAYIELFHLLVSTTRGGEGNTPLLRTHLRVVGIVELLEHEGVLPKLRHDGLCLAHSPAHALSSRRQHQLRAERLSTVRIQDRQALTGSHTHNSMKRSDRRYRSLHDCTKMIIVSLFPRILVQDLIRRFLVKIHVRYSSLVCRRRVNEIALFGHLSSRSGPG